MKTKKQTILIFSVAAAILTLPLIAMQFTTEVNWTVSDFAVMAFLLFATAFCTDFILRKVPKMGQRFFYIALALIIFLLIWAELAVGIFGSPFAGS